MSETTDLQAAFAAALVAFQNELPRVTKGQEATVPTKSGGSYKYSYADLSAVAEIVLPLLAKHGLAFTACPALIGPIFVLRCSLVHKDGWFETGEYPLPDPSTTTPQQIGSAITYARRYALTALTGVAPSGDDDDAQHANDTRAARRPEPVSAEDPWAGTDVQPPVSEAPAKANGSLGDLRNRILKAGDKAGVQIVRDFKERYGIPFSQGSQTQLDEYLNLLTTGALA